LICQLKDVAFVFPRDFKRGMSSFAHLTQPPRRLLKREERSLGMSLAS
jgi:hypothetical protein